MKFDPEKKIVKLDLRGLEIVEKLMKEEEAGYVSFILCETVRDHADHPPPLHRSLSITL